MAATVAKPHYGDFDFQKFMSNMRENPSDPRFHGAEYQDQGFFIQPISDGQTFDQSSGLYSGGALKSYRVTKSLGKGDASRNVWGGGGSAEYENAVFDDYGPDGQYMSSSVHRNMGTSRFTDIVGVLAAIGSAAVVGGAVAGTAAAGAGGSSAAAGAGASTAPGAAGVAIEGGAIGAVPGGAYTGATAIPAGASVTVPGAAAAAGSSGAGAGAGGATGGGGVPPNPYAASGSGGIVDTITKAASTPLGKAALQSGVSTLISSLVAGDGKQDTAGVNAGGAPGAATPEPPKMPDPLPTATAQTAAKRRSIIEQLARSGRASTILTKPTAGRLGG